MSKFKPLLAASIGNILELYDFAIYAFLMPTIGPLFFPNANKLTSLVLSFGVFAASFLTRPLGGILFGHLGDKKGRTKALSLSLILMALCTGLMGLLPTYAQIGILAPILLTVLRLAQGLCLGGEYSGSLIIVLEHIGYDSKKRPGLMGSLVTAASISGLLLGLAVSHLCQPPFLPESFWRTAFLIGALTGLLGFYIRKNMQEPEVLNKPSTERFPLISLLSDYPGTTFATVGMGALTGALFYGLFVFPISFLPAVMGVPPHLAKQCTLVGAGLCIIFLPIMGLVSDRIGHYKLMGLSALATICLAFSLFSLFSYADTPRILVAQIIAALLTASFMAPVSVVMSEIFPAKVRYTGASFSYNLGLCLLGAATPAISLMLVKETGSVVAPATYLIGCATFGLISAIIGSVLKKEQDKPIVSS